MVHSEEGGRPAECWYPGRKPDGDGEGLTNDNFEEEGSNGRERINSRADADACANTGKEGNNSSEQRWEKESKTFTFGKERKERKELASFRQVSSAFPTGVISFLPDEKRERVGGGVNSFLPDETPSPVFTNESQKLSLVQSSPAPSADGDTGGQVNFKVSQRPPLYPTARRWTQAVYDAGGRIEKGEDGRCTLSLPDSLLEAKRKSLEADALHWLGPVCEGFLTDGEAQAFLASL
jgi:hypothetical protein